MTARNTHVEKLVLSTLARILKPRLLSVFCVSNMAYKKNRTRAKAHELAMKGSGIPRLRTHCHKIPSQAQFRVGHHFLTVRLKSLVQQVQLWLAGGSQETMPNHATVQRLLESVQGNLRMVSRASPSFIKDGVLLLVDTLNFTLSKVTGGGTTTLWSKMKFASLCEHQRGVEYNSSVAMFLSMLVSHTFIYLECFRSNTCCTRDSKLRYFGCHDPTNGFVLAYIPQLYRCNVTNLYLV